MVITPFGVAALCVAFFVIWTLIDSDMGLFNEDRSPEVGEDGWLSPAVKPDAPGRYFTRLVGKPATESLSTVWTGESWTYLDGSDCYLQEREWKPMPESLMR